MAGKINRRIVDFDEAISDSITKEFGLKELPLKSRVFTFVLLVTALLIGSVGVRIVSLGGFDYGRYLMLASGNVNEETRAVAPRGLITDRYGKELVTNEAVFNARLEIPVMIKNGEEDRVFDAVTALLSLQRETVIKLISKTNIEIYPDIILSRDIGTKAAIDLKSLGLKSLYVENGYKRQYTSISLAHTLGFVGFSDVDNSFKGRTGLEAYYDDLLRGQDGETVTRKNALGEAQGTEVVSEPKQGNELKTTIDYDLQEHFYKSMLKGLGALGKTSGVGLAINPATGEVLSLISLPTFNPNDLSAPLSGVNKPFFNRAVSGVYNPGSVIKPLHASAVLKENIVSPTKQILSIGYIELPNPYFPDKPSRFLDWRAHGWVDLYSAIARSSDVYFYEVVGGFEGLKGLGIDKINDYWRKFGLDKVTGIDLPSESHGFLPNPAEKEARSGTPWRVGDTYNIAIGQGDLAVTPLEIVNGIASIANGGPVYTPHIKQSDPKKLMDLSDLAPQFTEVRHGMEDAVTKSYGTAHALSTLPMKIAAKTGSAQIENNTKTNALFIGYAPIEKPEIEVFVLVEDAKEGSLNAVPIAKDVMEWYYENRIKNK